MLCQTVLNFLEVRIWHDCIFDLSTKSKLRYCEFKLVKTIIAEPYFSYGYCPTLLYLRNKFRIENIRLLKTTFRIFFNIRVTDSQSRSPQ